MYYIFFIHSSISGYLGCFHVLTIVNRASVNVGGHVPFWIMVFSRYMFMSGIAGSYGRSIFSLVRDIHTILHSGHTNLYSHQYRKAPEVKNLKCYYLVKVMRLAEYNLLFCLHTCMHTHTQRRLEPMSVALNCVVWRLWKRALAKVSIQDQWLSESDFPGLVYMFRPLWFGDSVILKNLSFFQNRRKMQFTF